MIMRQKDNKQNTCVKYKHTVEQSLRDGYTGTFAQALRLLVSLAMVGIARHGGRKRPELLGMQIISYS